MRLGKALAWDDLRPRHGGSVRTTVRRHLGCRYAERTSKAELSIRCADRTKGRSVDADWSSRDVLRCPRRLRMVRADAIKYAHGKLSRSFLHAGGPDRAFESFVDRVPLEIRKGRVEPGHDAFDPEGRCCSAPDDAGNLRIRPAKHPTTASLLCDRSTDPPCGRAMAPLRPTE